MYSVIIPWADRLELETTLTANGPLFTRHSVEVIVINGGGEYAQLLSLARGSCIPHIRLIDLPGVTFSRSLCINVGASISHHEYLFFLDADIVLNSDIFSQAIDHLRSGVRYVTLGHLINSDRNVDAQPFSPDLSYLAELIETTEYITVDGRRAVLTSRRVPGSHPGHGLVLLTTHAMYSVGGLNSSFRGWGYEDTDLQLRLQFLLGLERVDVGEGTHLAHSHSTRGQLAWRQNMCMASRNYSRGHYLGTLASDAAEWRTKLVEVNVT